jgi:hypothetical protein
VDLAARFSLPVRLDAPLLFYCRGCGHTRY